MDFSAVIHTVLMMTAGLTDNVGPAFQAGAEARLDNTAYGFSFGLEVRGVLPGKVVATEPFNTDLGEAPGPQAFDIGQVGVQAVPCLRFAKYFAGCGVVQAFWVLTSDEVFAQIPGGAAGPRVSVEIPFAWRLAFFGLAEALFPIVAAKRPFFAGSQGPLGPYVQWTQSPASGFFAAGLSLKID